MSHDETPAEGGTSGPPIKLILSLLIVVALAIFFFQNTHETNVEFLWVDANWPVWAVIGISAVAGAAIAKLAGLFWARARQRTPRR